MNAFARMSSREKLLAAVVGSAVFLLINLFVFTYFFRTQTRLRTEYAVKNERLKSARVLFAQKDLWARREAWIQQTQPKLVNEAGAGVELLEQIKQAAKAADVLLENPALGVPQKQPTHRAVPVSIETKSTWTALIGFLHAIQEPGKFVVLETANIQIEPTDPTLMRGKFRVARWYAP